MLTSTEQALGMVTVLVLAGVGLGLDEKMALALILPDWKISKKNLQCVCLVAWAVARPADIVAEGSVDWEGYEDLGR
jgi:hypothetical protein